MNELSDGWAAFKMLWGVAVSGIGFLAVKQVGRIDKLEATRVQKEDHDREVAYVRDEHQRNVERLDKSIAELRAETQTGFNRVFTRLDDIADRIAR